MNLKERAKKLKTDLPAVYAKILAGITVLYALSPIDLIPDFVPVLGYLDDVIILPALVALTVKLIPKEIFAQCQIDSVGLWENGKPKKWYYALPIVAIWLLILYFVINAIWLNPHNG